MILDLLLILFLILLNGIFSLSETAVLSSRKARLKHKADEGHFAYRMAYDTAMNPRAFLSTIQVGITLIGVLAGALGGATLTEEFTTWIESWGPLAPYASTLSIVLIVAMTTFVSVVVGELVPKTVALQNPEMLAALFVVPTRLLTALFSPVVHVLTWTTDIFLRIFGLHNHKDLPVTEEEIQVLMSQGVEAGVFEKVEHRMVEGILDLGDRRLKSIMTHRMDIVSLQLGDEPAKVLKTLGDYGEFSYFPVCRGDIEDMAGVIVAKEILTDVAQGIRKPLKAYLYPPIFIPEMVSPLKVLESLKKTKVKLAFIIDEYGGVEGLVTMTDLYDFVFGETVGHAMEVIVPPVQDQGQGVFHVDGTMPAEDFFRAFKVRSRPDQAHYSTLAGFLLILFNRIPKPGDVTRWENLQLEVLAMEGHRIAQVKVSLPPPERTTPV